MLALLAALLAASAGEASARCAAPGDLDALVDSLAGALGCRVGYLTTGKPAGGCPAPSFPACAEPDASEILALVVGENPSPVGGWTASSLDCQRGIVLASVMFLDRRLAQRAAGQRRSQASRAMEILEKSCREAKVELNGSGQKLVRVGAPCSSLLGPAGTPIGARRLSRCLRAGLEAKIDDVSPTPMAPNIVLIVTDDQRWDSLDVMPRVSALRDEGISFTNAFVTNPVCTPSRASILTGRYSRNNGVLSNGHFASLDEADTIAARLAEAGYINGLFGKYVNNSEQLGLEPPEGWHVWKSFLHPSGGAYYDFRLNDNGVVKQIAPGRHSTGWMGNEVMKFIRRAKNKPFFVMFTPFAPHAPSIPALAHRDALDWLPPWRPPSWHDDVADKPTWVRFYQSIRLPTFTEDTDRSYRDANRTLLSVDDAVGRILDELEELGLSDNTIVLFTSDHGLMFGEHWLTLKFNPYEESIRVPFIVRYPRLAPLPGTREQMVLNLDIAPTFEELTGAEMAPDLDGLALTPLLESPSAPWRDDFLIETLGEFITAPSESVRTDRWKYVDTHAKGGITRELYDLEVDPLEQRNLAFDPAHADVLEEMILRLDALRAP